MPTSKPLSFGCLMVLAVLAVPGVAADWSFGSLSDNEVYPADPPPARPSFSRAHVRNMSETTDLREFIMKYVQDERICSMTALRDFILAEDGSDERAKVWWSRRCGGRRGGAPSFPASQSPESTLIRYRRKSSNRENPQNSLDRSKNDKKRLNKISKLMKDKRLLCKPKRKAVPLPNPDPSTITLQPECVYIRQCSGCCNSDKLECLPTRNKTKTFPAMVVRTYHDTYRMDQNPIKMVKVVEHRECKCECKVRAEHCTPSQVYVEDACQCQCPQLSRVCPSRKQTWNDRNCRCECTKPKNCTTGRYFDVNTCRCADPLRV